MSDSTKNTPAQRAAAIAKLSMLQQEIETFLQDASTRCEQAQEALEDAIEKFLESIGQEDMGESAFVVRGVNEQGEWVRAIVINRARNPSRVRILECIPVDLCDDDDDDDDDADDADDA